MVNPPLKLLYLKISQIKKMSDGGDLYVNSDYQRSTIWEPKLKKNLIESIINNHPIGALTIWENRSKMEVLDGQQRINSIVTFLKNEFEDNSGKRFENLSPSTKENFLNYSIPCLQVISVKESEVSSIFVRLQEGKPLNIAEKTHALTGLFKDSFMEIFNSNPLFFKNFSNKRLRATLLAAQFLTLELKVNFSDKYPSLRYEDFVRMNDYEFKNEIPESRLRNCDENIKFMYATLYNLLRQISPRDIISIYMLVSYIRKNVKNYTNLGEQFREFVTMMEFEFSRFSIYDTAAPEGMTKKKFEAFLEYKNVARKAATPDSLAKRFEFYLKEWTEFKPKILTDSIQKKDFKKIPNHLLSELSEKSLSDILNENESIYLEFKQSVFSETKNESVEIAKTIAAFLNTDGGLIVLGVNPGGKIVGLDQEIFKNEERKWADWKERLSETIDDVIGSQFKSLWKIEKIDHNEKTCVIIKVKKSREPVFAKIGTSSKFFTRYFSQNRELRDQNRIQYIDVVFR